MRHERSRWNYRCHTSQLRHQASATLMEDTQIDHGQRHNSIWTSGWQQNTMQGEPSMPSSAISGSPLILIPKTVTLRGHDQEWQKHLRLVVINHDILTPPRQA
ncbi:hypothetical protein [Prochlorococcus marinus]|uniref:hypothetical protein n=2 Tax=Prochlorococcaceae TaxID=2881426 RepID=UPI0007B3F224